MTDGSLPDSIAANVAAWSHTNAQYMQWPGEQGIEYHLAHGDWIDLLRGTGFEIERLIELRAPAGAEAHPYYDYVTPDWAGKWPHEEIWVARRS